ncbi:MAG: T9SS type A sorting domain-containing protein, partial [Bacteroidetes bacterium]|nr:T9SS type A sorting domain-containing protein [Bacteroidota bacterium]
SYKPDLNLKKYSICATLKVAGFYSGVCQGNVLLARGKPGTDGSYEVDFDDNPNDGADCYSMDTTKDVFVEWAGGSGLGVPITSWADTNTVSEGKWYSVVATYDDTTYNIYLNGQLTKSLFVGYRSMDSTGDSLSIGMDIYETAAGFPYSFKGIMDDVRLYNRVLDTSEITTYTNSTVGDTLNHGNGNGNGNGDTSHLAVNQIKVQTNVMHFYPNPARDVLTVYFNQPIKNTELKILNELGQEVRSITINGTNAHIPVKDLAAGMYFIRVANENEIITNRFMKK